MASSVILTDIDNTLYDWPRFFAPSFRAMVHALSDALDTSEEQLYREFKEVFGRHASLEYAFAIQELESVKHLDTAEVRDLVRRGRGAFKSVQRKHLKPYAQVIETLRWLYEQGHVTVGITNSSIFRAQHRLYDLGLDKYMVGLVAWEGFTSQYDRANDGYVPLTRERRRTRIKRSVAIPVTDCKPSEKHYAIALREFADDETIVWVIGDSLHKDLAPAGKLGIKTIWARYGAGLDRKDKDQSTLLKITHWSDSKIQQTYDMESFEPDYIIDSFAEIRKIVPTTMATLF